MSVTFCIFFIFIFLFLLFFISFFFSTFLFLCLCQSPSSSSESIMDWIYLSLGQLSVCCERKCEKQLHDKKLHREWSESDADRCKNLGSAGWKRLHAWVAKIKVSRLTSCQRASARRYSRHDVTHPRDFVEYDGQSMVMATICLAFNVLFVFANLL